MFTTVSSTSNWNIDRQKTKFWQLRTLASKDFDLTRLTERQQMAYMAAQSTASNPLLNSLFRMDRLLARNESPFEIDDTVPQTNCRKRRNRERLPRADVSSDRTPRKTDSNLHIHGASTSVTEDKSPLLATLSCTLLENQNTDTNVRSNGLKSKFDQYCNKLQEIRLRKEQISRCWGY